jgi:hypothetical protein
MHPEIMRELHSQHHRDLQQRAHRAHLARTVSRALRALRHSTGVAEADGFVMPAVPDYVDGSFRTTGDQVTSQVPAARHAA